MEAWIAGAAFHELGRFTDVDEGILIRYFRMVLQIVRQMRHAPSVPQHLKENCSKAVPLLNRDIVDAERLLRNI